MYIKTPIEISIIHYNILIKYIIYIIKLYAGLFINYC